MSESPTNTPPVNDTDAAIQAGIELARPTPLSAAEGRFYTQVVPASAKVQVHDLNQLQQALAEHPHRKTGTVHVHDADSFVEYIEKHGLAATEVWADAARQGLVGVINAHAQTDAPDEEGLAGHGDHRVLLELIPSEEWKTWTVHDKKWLNQADFAEHLEDNAVNVVDPDAAFMLEVAQSFQATRSADFKAGTRLDNGLVQIRFEETGTATAGQSGDLEIPTAFTVLLAPFVGSAPVEVTARFRYRINGGNLFLSYALLNPGDIARSVFGDIVDSVRSAIEPPVYLGRPA